MVGGDERGCVILAPAAKPVRYQLEGHAPLGKSPCSRLALDATRTVPAAYCATYSFFFLHDGRVCFSRSCRNPLWATLQTVTRFPAAKTASSLYFSIDADVWDCAIDSMGEKVMRLPALDLSTALPSCQAWPWLTSKVVQMCFE